MMNKALIVLAFIFMMSLFFLSCNSDDSQEVVEREWELSWSDEFNAAANTGVDLSKWTFDIGRGSNGWGNQELQYYTDDLSNISHDGQGNLIITAREEGFNGASFTSARIKTEGIFEQTYGKFEARLKTPFGPGLWPAFWLLGEDSAMVSWPQRGEIDIMELRGQFPSVIHGSLHGPGYSGGAALSASNTLNNSRYDTDFHLFTVEWGADYIDYYVDNKLYFSIKPDDVPGEWVYDHPFFIILNVAVGGNFVGSPTQGTSFPQRMTIDYVRVYKEI